jgi:hypothetical protein
LYEDQLCSINTRVFHKPRVLSPASFQTQRTYTKCILAKIVIFHRVTKKSFYIEKYGSACFAQSHLSPMETSKILWPKSAEIFLAELREFLYDKEEYLKGFPPFQR